MLELILKGGHLVDPVNGVYRADLGIAQGRIAAILAPGTPVESARTIDVTGSHVFPGLIEPHTHMGYTNGFAEDVRTESASAALGGVTTLFSFHRHYKSAEPKPYHDFPEIVEAINANALIDVGLHFGMLIEEQIKEIERYIDWGVSSFKFYMAYRGADGKVVGMINEIDDGLMFEAFEVLARHPHAVACVHCENTEIIARRVQRLKLAGADGLAAWNAARPSFAEAEHVRRAGYFAELTGCNLYYVHIGAKPSLEEALLHKERYARLTIETCPHYLTLTEDSPVGLLAKVNPPVRTRVDLDRIWEALLRGEVATVGTDHCAMPRARKAGDVWKAAAGFPGMGTTLPVMLDEGHHKRGMPLDRIAQVTSYNVAKAFNLLPRKGTLAVGADADLAVADINLEKTVDSAQLASSSDFSLQEGQRLRGWPVMTIARGEIVAEGGRVVAKPGRGRFLKR